jgi:hypothetical protein
LLRTYPFRDFSLWPADKDLSKPRDYWNPAKADQNGLIWTTPYISAITQDWVIACITAAMAGNRVIAVVGCEISVSGLAGEVFAGPATNSESSWLIKPLFHEGDTPQQWIVLAAQVGAESQLGVFPLGAAPVPDDKHTGSDILDEADMLAHGDDQLLALIEANVDAHAPGFADLTSHTAVAKSSAGQFLASAPVATAGWLLCSTATSPALGSLEQFENNNRRWLQQKLLLTAGILLLAMLMAFMLAWFEARKIVHPLSILAEQVRNAAITQRTSSVTFADEGEIGALADAVQELIDATTDRNGNGSSDHDVPASDDE